MSRRRRNAEETEAHSRYGRRVYAYLSRPGVLAAIKRRTSKADRREGRDAIREEYPR